MISCPVCHTSLRAGIRSWHATCPDCHYEKAAFSPEINALATHDLVDEAARETGLRQLRVDNFSELLQRISQQLPAGASLLDVGCAHGWFLEQARGHFNVLGIEPDEYVAQQTKAKGLALRCGYFPQVLTKDERFDAIVFNDVFEHIPDVVSVLNHCREHLVAGGLLILNLPSSRGAYYVASKFLARVGWDQPFERMWQKALPSPHLHYFDGQNLSRLLIAHGFEVTSSGSLPTVRLKGLYERIVCAKGFGRLGDWLIYLLALTSLPFVKLFPSDIVYVMARKPSVA